MNNKENYKKAIDQIKASEELKQKTIERIKYNRKSKKIVYMKYIAACAIVMLMFSSGFFYSGYQKTLNYEKKTSNPIQIAKVNNDLPRFKNIEQLRDILKEQDRVYMNTNKAEIAIGGMVETQDAMTMDTSKELSETTNRDYSTTNVQVENVDEADIVKTDGNYIYYVTNGYIYIIRAEDLKEISKITLDTNKEDFSPQEIYVLDNKLVVLGNSYNYEEQDDSNAKIHIQRIKTENFAKVIVLDITDRANPIEERVVALDGNYVNSRMIGDNLYFISNKYPDYHYGILDNEILPLVKDNLNEDRIIECTDIAYFKDTDSHMFMTVAGFNIKNNEEVNTETFFGASSNIYCSENNLYITQLNYDNGYWGNTNNVIYKFNLKDSNIILQCKGEVKGYLNNQFSMDEYEGNLRIATTAGYNDDSSNELYILDENLKELSRIDNMARGERIYAVRFIGKIGYVVTFKQIDPLFVIDLSNPYNPEIKGELKIPGYSSYLHPYDENHIIGIGYNTKDNGYGGVTNANMKMSMFDVSDLENPRELFNVDIGGSYVSSPITYNHKALFYNSNRNLIGFPITSREHNYYQDKNGFVLYNIDLEEGFIKHGEILQNIHYRTNINRGIYIGDKLYTLAENQIVKYDLNTLEKLAEIYLAEINDYPYDTY